MKFEFTEKITYPVERVFPLLRDNTKALVPHLPNIIDLKRIETRELEGNRLHTVKEWTGTPSSVPPVMRPFVASDNLKWLDHADWDNEKHTVTWRMETTTFTGLYTCEGVNYVRDIGNGHCEVQITGNLTVHGDKLPGVPRLLGRKMAPTIEKWVVGNVTPNIASMPVACQSYLDSLS